jgi:hypothetical protein
MTSLQEILDALERIAVMDYGGHFTIMRFSFDWRVGFGTPADRCDLEAMAVGSTFEEAAARAVANPEATRDRVGERYELKLRFEMHERPFRRERLRRRHRPQGAHQGAGSTPLPRRAPDSSRWPTPGPTPRRPHGRLMLTVLGGLQERLVLVHRIGAHNPRAFMNESLGSST